MDAAQGRVRYHGVLGERDNRLGLEGQSALMRPSLGYIIDREVIGDVPFCHALNCSSNLASVSEALAGAAAGLMPMDAVSSNAGSRTPGHKGRLPEGKSSPRMMAPRELYQSDARPN